VDSLYDDRTIDAVAKLKETLAALANLMPPELQPDVDAWQEAVAKRLLPRLRPEFPLVAAICGGGSAGKSTLFNTLIGQAVSPTGGRAGMNRRPLIALSTVHREQPGVAEALLDPFDCPPRLMENTEQLTTPGDPLLFYTDGLPAGLALLDTPDFDTGAGGNYQNREMAERSLRAADVLVYLFTNANYNNRDNTDFIARMLTSVGTRNSFLIYRAYAAFSDQEIKDHAGTVARNLYGEKARQHVLGVYRAGEDNRVAAGQQPLAVVPVGQETDGLLQALSGMDPRQVKGDLHRSIFKDVIAQGRGFLDKIKDSQRHLTLYLEGLRTVQRKSVQEAMGHLPMDAVVRRFSKIWRDTDPSHVKIMRQTGKVVETPVRLMMKAARWMGRGQAGLKTDKADSGSDAALEADLMRAANGLRKAAVDPQIVLSLAPTDPMASRFREGLQRLAQTGNTGEPGGESGLTAFTIPLHPALRQAQRDLIQDHWAAVVDSMLARKETLLGLTGQLEKELQRLAAEQRSRMSTFDQVRQTFSALLNIIPATAAGTYVLHTGDPVGATGIKVKLAGLFGLNDLYALVAIPATSGMKKADLKQLEALLAPVARAWLTYKLTAVEALFEEKITGGMLQTGAQALENAAGGIASMEESLNCCVRVLGGKA
jgi:hypothetical protein